MATRPASRRRAAWVLAIAAVVVTADQVTKALAVRDLQSGPVHLVGPFSFALGYNRGVAFSLFTQVGVPIVLIAASLVGLVIWLTRGNPTRLGAVAIGLVTGGATGNLADRVFRADGAVVDFIHTGFWPTFNVADSAIVVGCALVAWTLARSDQHHVDVAGGEVE